MIFKIKWYSWFKHVIFVICLFGLLVHFYIIFDNIIGGDLSEKSYHEKIDSLKWPELVFCLKINKSRIDENKYRTGNYLSSLFKGLTLNFLFEKIEFTDKNGDHKSIEKELFLNQNAFEVKTFLLNNLKCLELTPLFLLKEEDFILDYNPFPFKFYLNKSFPPNSILYFNCKKRNTTQFNQFNEFNFT